MVMLDRKEIVGIMSRIIIKCQNNGHYTIVDNFQTDYISGLFVVCI